LTHFEWIVDPSQDENCYGSNNLVQVTVVQNEDDQTVMIDKSHESLKTSFPNQHGAVGAALSLNFKTTYVTLPQMNEAVKLGSTICRKAIAKYQESHENSMEID
jgi:hypothetical protein